MKGFKNWEKELLRKIENSFRNLKSYISSAWKSFIKKGNEKITIMFIPHNQKKIINIHLSLFAIFFFIIFFSLLIFLFFITTSTLASYANELSSYKVQLENYKSSYKNLVNLVDNTYGVFKSLKVNFAKFASIFNTRKNILSELGQGGPEIKLNEDQKLDNYDKLLLIQQGSQQLTIFLQKYFKNKKELEYLHKHIPSGWPILGGKGRITSPFGIRKDPFSGVLAYHFGIDIAARFGIPILATADGIVYFAGRKNGYGNVIIIQHKFGFYTYYAHLSVILVRKGQYIRKGQIIGKEGMSGRATGPHVHYGIKINNTFINPSDFLYYNLENF